MDHTRKATKETFYLETSVFPLLDVRESVGNTPGAVEYLGTCFLVRLAQNHVFVTVRHLLHEAPDKYNLYIAYSTPDGQASYIKVSAIYTDHLKRDISFFIPTPAMRKQYEHLLDPMTLLRHPLPVGQCVLVYGFPDSGQHSVSAGVPVVNIHRTRYEGKVLEVERGYGLAPMSTVYHLPFPSPRGLSGSPVMVEHRGTIVVAGYIIGQQTTNGRSVAIAADYTPLVKIEQLLIDVSRKLASGDD